MRVQVDVFRCMCMNVFVSARVDACVGACAHKHVSSQFDNLRSMPVCVPVECQPEHLTRPKFGRNFLSKMLSAGMRQSCST